MARVALSWLIGISGIIAALSIFSGPLKCQEKYDLRYKFTPGKVFHYRKYLEGSLREPNESKVLHLQFLDQWEVTGGDGGEGIFTVKETGSEYQGTRLDLRELGLPAEGEPVERQMDVLGRVARVVHYQKGSRYYLNCLTFPGRPVAVGESWKYNPTLTFTPFGRTVNTPVNIIYTLEKTLKYKGIPCARINFSGSYRHHSETGDVVVGGEISGKAYFDLKEGLEVDYEVKEVRTQRLISERIEENLEVKITSLKK